MVEEWALVEEVELAERKRWVLEDQVCQQRVGPSLNQMLSIECLSQWMMSTRPLHLVDKLLFRSHWKRTTLIIKFRKQWGLEMRRKTFKRCRLKENEIGMPPVRDDME